MPPGATATGWLRASVIVVVALVDAVSVTLVVETVMCAVSAGGTGPVVADEVVSGVVLDRGRAGAKGESGTTWGTMPSPGKGTLTLMGAFSVALINAMTSGVGKGDWKVVMVTSVDGAMGVVWETVPPALTVALRVAVIDLVGVMAIPCVAVGAIEAVDIAAYPAGVDGCASAWAINSCPLRQDPRVKTSSAITARIPATRPGVRRRARMCC